MQWGSVCACVFLKPLQIMALGLANENSKLCQKNWQRVVLDGPVIKWKNMQMYVPVAIVTT